MKGKWTALGALMAGLSVALGAFAAHGLQKHLDTGLMDERMLHNFETAARYQMYHSVALILAGLAFAKYPSRISNFACWSFLIGIFLFSGSLYLLSTRNVIGLTSWQWLGPVTPLGGLAFMTGWTALAWTYFKNNGSKS